MHKFIKTVSIVALCFVLSLSCFAAGTQAPDMSPEQGIKFAAYCTSAEQIEQALTAGADYISLGGAITYTEADAIIGGNAEIIIDAASIDEAERLYAELSITSPVSWRIDASASNVSNWAADKDAKIIGYYKGNIYPAAISLITKTAKLHHTAVQMQTVNPDGVVLHRSVMYFVDRLGCVGMFSFAAPEKSAGRTDSARSWDDLIARGYTIIETAYPAEFSAYLENNMSEKNSLAACITAAKAIDTDGCPPNRVATLEKTLEAAQSLVNDSTSATYAISDAKAELNEAIKNIHLNDGSKIKGDLKFTPGRIAAAVFAVCLVLSWQLFFRSRWDKKKK